MSKSAPSYTPKQREVFARWQEHCSKNPTASGPELVFTFNAAEAVGNALAEIAPSPDIGFDP
jgi:hypothetical protein